MHLFVWIGYHVDVHVFVILRMFKGLVSWNLGLVKLVRCGAATVLCQPATLKKTWKCNPIISYTHCLMIKFYCVRVITYFLVIMFIPVCFLYVCVCVATRHVEFLIIFMFRFVSIRLHNSVFICGFFEGCSFHSYMMLYEYFMSFLNDYMICCRFNLCSKICVFIQNIVFNIWFTPTTSTTSLFQLYSFKKQLWKNTRHHT